MVGFFVAGLWFIILHSNMHNMQSVNPSLFNLEQRWKTLRKEKDREVLNNKDV